MEPPEREFSKEEIMSEFKILIKLHGGKPMHLR